MTITWTKCVFVASVIQHAMRMYHTVTCGLSGFTMFFTYFLNKNFRKKKWTRNVCFDHLCSFCLQHFSLQEEFSKMLSPSSCVFKQSSRYSCHILTTTWILSTDFRKILNIRFHENSSTGRWVFPCGRTDGQTEKTKLFLIFLTCLRRITKSIIFSTGLTQSNVWDDAEVNKLQPDRNIAIILNKSGLCEFHKHMSS
jgi:hypothetical protein